MLGAHRDTEPGPDDARERLLGDLLRERQVTRIPLGGLRRGDIEAYVRLSVDGGASPQIVDASGDGHHPGTDVLAAWWSEAAGHLQAVIQVRAGLFVAEHDDAEVNGSGFAFVFSQGGVTRYVRANAPAQDHESDPVTFDYGTYTSPGGFAIAGATTGAVERSTGPGTVTIDVPGAAVGSALTNASPVGPRPGASGKAM